MRFAVQVGAKTFPVSVMREPTNISALSNFDYKGRTYIGLQEQFNGLRLDKIKKTYSAISIIVTDIIKPKINIEVKEIVEEEIIDPIIIQEIVEDICLDNNELEEIDHNPTPEEIAEEPVIEEIEEIPELIEDEKSELKTQFLEELEEESLKLKKITEHEVKNIKNNGIKKLTFRSRWASLFPEAETYGEGLFETHKHVWIIQHGSEHLKMAHEMKCKCDGLYVQERAVFEFPKWSIHELLVYYEVDSPDFGILTFLKNFQKLHRELLNSYKSKVLLTTTDNLPDEENATVVITDYLGHCDLSISLVDLVELYGDCC